MKHELPALPYAMNALAPHISAETLEYHHGKHHAKYVSTLNELIAGTEFDGPSLEEVVRKSCSSSIPAASKIFNNAAQAWNHAFYWNCLSPKGGGKPTGDVAKAIERDFGSFEKFRDAFVASAGSLFGSGWTWLVLGADGKLSIENAPNAATPIAAEGKTPILTCDVWEHAYYIDYRNARPKYLAAYWNIVNWEFANRQLAGK